MHIGTPPITPLKSNGLIGQVVTETASIAYDGTLLPTGTASYGGISIDATKRYLKNSGKDKTPALVEAGQGKFFNGTSQYIAETWANIGYTGVKTAFTLSFNVSNILNSNYLFNSGYESSNQGWSVKLNGTASIQFFTNLGTDAGMVMSLGGITNPTVTYTFNNGLVRGYVNGVFKIEKQFSITNVNFVSAEKFCIGAYRASSSYASATVSSVSFYTDTVLSDSQIQSLYLYPEKVKAYNGAIVPDIGSEANCKLFLPLCENSGSNVVNVAVARGSELVVNGGFDTDTTGWSKSGDGTISVLAAKLQVTGGTTNTFCTQSIPTISGKLYLISYSSFVGTSTKYSVRVNGLFIEANVTTYGSKQFIFTASSTTTLIELIAYTGEAVLFDNVSVKEITAYPLTNYTTAMHTSAAKLSYGAQCTAWKRDSLGVLLGMSNGLSFDGWVSVNGVSTGWIPNVGASFVIECIQYIDAVATGKINGVSATGRVSLGQSTANSVRFILHPHDSAYAGVATGYRHIVMKYDFGLKRAWSWVDGVVKWDNRDVTTFTASPTSPFSFGAETVVTANLTSIEGTPKIYKGAQYAKFDITKAWAKAQKTIAKLGA